MEHLRKLFMVIWTLNHPPPPCFTSTFCLESSLESDPKNERIQPKSYKNSSHKNHNFSFKSISKANKFSPPQKNKSHNLWLAVSTHFKNMSQIGSFPQVGVKIKNLWNHQLDIVWLPQVMHKFIIPPTNHPFGKEYHLPNLHDYVPAVNLPGCNLQQRNKVVLLLPTPLHQ